MIYTISNEKMTVQINSTGAQLWSVKSNCDGCEYLWQGDPAFWSMRATVLFPICGRLFGGKYTWEGKEYEMVLHGIVKNAEFEMVAQSETAITFEKKADDETKAIYPFDFTFRLTYSLDGLTLRETAEIINTGAGVLPFSFGGHPGFNVPLGGKGAFTDYYMEFSDATAPRRLNFSPTCFLSGGDTELPLRDGKILPLRHDMFDDDAIFIRQMADSVTLKSDATSKSVTLTYPGFRFLGFWHRPKAEAPYVCIEPWYGIPSTDGIVDDFSHKQAMDLLPAGERKELSFSISITE